jgi:biotin carboxylase
MRAASVLFDRVAVLGPVEAARRFIRTAREVGDERGRRLHVVAFQADPRRSDAAVRAADEVVALAGDGQRGFAEALAAAKVDALWPGWAAGAEDPDTAAICARLGVRFLGSDPVTLGRDRIELKLLAEGAGLRVVPWNGGSLNGPDAAVDAAATLGYPVMLKAAAGGGRAGIRRVDDAAELLSVIDQADAEAQASFGDPTLYLEELLDGARHLEVTVVADAYGKVWTFGPHDATLRRRGDKIVIESTGAGLTPADIQAVGGAVPTPL